MKTIGLLGGMSWESTVTYYQLVNRGVGERLGGWHCAEIAMFSVDFNEYVDCMRAGQWDRIGEKLSDGARRVEAAGADLLLICTNTMHKMADVVAGSVNIPLIHIGDATAEAVKADGLSSVGLLGTAFTMEDGFLRDRLAGHGIETLVPEKEDRDRVHAIIFDELVKGVITDESRAEYLRIINDLRRRGAQGVVLGCTEIGLLVGPDDTDLPLFDTAVIHAGAAVEAALG
ncbi:aspartate/glutamate racemase family protein [Salidesulfovibrio onnuriiensis]|uniref:aspartate/glutamate racemase family protein n=1 Tax=Salidesulfovibrio onnuriiensis TaxID=2583823 RepID=UPI0011CA06E5|nr:aspartate/glutamate racemase family protein [Salidesulfovibrio onnuriiensis]